MDGAATKVREKISRCDLFPEPDCHQQKVRATMNNISLRRNKSQNVYITFDCCYLNEARTRPGHRTFSVLAGPCCHLLYFCVASFLPVLILNLASV
jgi:hypothetical protein